MHFATAPCKISGSLPEIFLIEREGRALPPFTLPPAALFLQPFLLFRRVAFILQHALLQDFRQSAGNLFLFSDFSGKRTEQAENTEHHNDEGHNGGAHGGPRK